MVEGIPPVRVGGAFPPSGDSALQVRAQELKKSIKDFRESVQQVSALGEPELANLANQAIQLQSAIAAAKQALGGSNA